MTLTTAFFCPVGYESIDGGSDNLDWWNETGAVWMLAVESPSYEIHSQRLCDVGGLWPPQYTSAVHEDPESSQFTISVPTADCFGKSRPLSLLETRKYRAICGGIWASTSS